MIRFFLLFLLSFICYSACLASPDTLVYKGGFIPLNDHISFLEDPSANLTIKQVIHRPDFEQNGGKVPNFGVSKSVFWLKVSVKNQTKTALKATISYPILDRVSFYKVVNDSVLSIVNTGEAFSYSARSYPDVNFTFALKLKKDELATYYYRISSGEQIIVPISIGAQPDIIKSQTDNFLVFGLYAGIFLAMILYNMFLAVSTRDRTYLPYIAYIFFVGITQATLNGYSFKFFWPENPEIAIRATHLCGALSGVATILFVRSFLSTKIFAPKFNWLLNIFLSLYLLSILLALAGQLHLSYNIINLTAGIGSISLMVVAVYIYKKKNYRPALFFIIAWSVFILSILVFVLKDYGVIPYNNITISGLQIGSAIEVLLLSFALADRINILKAEKENSREQALQALQENERIVREQNVELEARVNARTLELSAANGELSQTLTDLKEAESQLVEAEKMASLGQLTAGIAHEINNPINFVTSNINPLKRDIDILFETIDTIESMALSAGPASEKQQQIEEYKEEIDLDYLKIEIGHLLKGIQEGSSRTADIVKGLRIFSRLDEDDLKKADINEGLDATLVIVNNLLNNKIELKKRYGIIPQIDCYPGKLNQVFLNIITNAIHAIQKKFGDQAGGEIIITTCIEKTSLFIKIGDNGTGMDEKTRKKVFEPFFTTKDVGQGTGLGMSIVYNTIRKHQGQISIETEPGVGTEFIIELPIIMAAVEII